MWPLRGTLSLAVGFESMFKCLFFVRVALGMVSLHRNRTVTKAGVDPIVGSCHPEANGPECCKKAD